MSTVWNLFAECPPTPAPALPSVWELFATGNEAPRRQTEPCALYFNEEMIFWAMRNLPVREASTHFMICGAAGSGKTTVIQLFLQSIAPRVRRAHREPEQLIIYDNKCEMIPTLAALGLPPDDERVWILNPFDRRCAVWNIAEAVQEPAMARYLATLLVPEEKDTSAPYFSNAARELVVAVIGALNSICGARWTFRDLLCALDSKEHIDEVTAREPRAALKAGQHINDGRHFPGVLSHLATKLGPLEQAAALWHSSRGARQFSVTEFLRSGFTSV